MKHQMACFVMVVSTALGSLGGCAGLNDRGQRLLASKVAAFAIINEQLLVGEMELFPSHTGTVTLRLDPVAVAEGSDAKPVATAAAGPPGRAPLTSCVGRFRYTGTTMGTIDLRCNDGATADLSMALMGATHGYGYGQTTTGLASLTFGLSTADARAHLTVPPNRQLLERSESDGLELK